MKQKNKAERLKNQKRRILSPLYTSLLSILLCMVCLAGTTWAWFTANQEVPIEPITSAQWELQSLEVYEVATGSDVSTQTDSNAPATQTKISVTEENGRWTFSASANKKYVVNASVNGTASNGFLLINTCDGSFYTIATQSNFSLLLSQDCTVQISASWGTDYGTASQFNSGDELGNGTTSTEATDETATQTETQTEGDSPSDGQIEIPTEPSNNGTGESTTTPDISESDVTSETTETEEKENNTENTETESVETTPSETSTAAIEDNEETQAPAEQESNEQT